MYLSNNLKTIRKKWGESQTAFGERFDVSKTAVSKWEIGSSEPPFAVLLWIEKQTGVRMGELIEVEILPEDIGSRPGEMRSKVMERESNSLKLKIGDLVMELQEAEREKVRVLEALNTLVEFLEKNIDKSVYEKEKNEYLERVAGIIGGLK